VKNGEPICVACREANTAANARWRVSVPRVKRFCLCGTEIRTDLAQCASCRKNQPTASGRAPKPAAASDAPEWTEEELRNMPRGWVRHPKTKILVHSLEPCNGYPCSQHDFCDQRAAA
jgi:hypothetical protein